MSIYINMFKVYGGASTNCNLIKSYVMFNFMREITYYMIRKIGIIDLKENSYPGDEDINMTPE